jgi:prevent-host-death family protein
MKKVTTYDAKIHLSRLLVEVEAGEEILICRGTTPAARLVPVSRQPARTRLRVGTTTSAPIHVADDAFTLLGPDELADWGLE